MFSSRLQQQQQQQQQPQQLQAQAQAQPQQEAEEQAPANALGFFCCSFSPDGTFIVAGGNDCNAYVWFWDVGPFGSKGGGRQAAARAAVIQNCVAPSGTTTSQANGTGSEAVKTEEGEEPEEGGSNGNMDTNNAVGAGSSNGAGRSRDGGRSSGGGASAGAGAGPASVASAVPKTGAEITEHWLPGREWPAPAELVKLEGHKNDINFLQFNHSGNAVATGALDGCVRVGDGAQATWTTGCTYRTAPHFVYLH